MLQGILKTDNSSSWLVLRVTLGIVMLGHGLQKALGWFGGLGWSNTVQYFNGVGLPDMLGSFIILIESVGAVLLILGLAGRVNAALMSVVILGAFFIDHLPNGFFMNWFNNQKGEGVEFDLLFLAISIVLTINGSGKFSIDRWLLRARIQKIEKLSPAI